MRFLCMVYLWGDLIRVKNKHKVMVRKMNRHSDKANSLKIAFQCGLYVIEGLYVYIKLARIWEDFQVSVITLLCHEF